MNYRFVGDIKSLHGLIAVCIQYVKRCFNQEHAYCVTQGDFVVPDIPKSMAWCENSICVGFKRDYYLIRVGQNPRRVTELKENQNNVP